MSSLFSKIQNSIWETLLLFSKGSTKYAIAERLGNYINPYSEIMEKFLSIDMNGLFRCIIGFDRFPNYGTDYHYRKYFIRNCFGGSLNHPNFDYYPRQPGCKVCIIISRKPDIKFLLDTRCQVSGIVQYLAKQSGVGSFITGQVC